MASIDLATVFRDESFRDILDGLTGRPYITDDKLTNLTLKLEGADIHTVSQLVLTPASRVVALTNNSMSAQAVSNIYEAARLSSRALVPQG